MERGEARTAQAAGLEGFYQSGSLLLGIVESPAHIRFYNSVIRSSHNPLRYDRYATLRPETSDGAMLHVLVYHFRSIENPDSNYGFILRPIHLCE